MFYKKEILFLLISISTLSACISQQDVQSIQTVSEAVEPVLEKAERLAAESSNLVENTEKVNVYAGVSVDSFIGNKVVEGLENRISLTIVSLFLYLLNLVNYLYTNLLN